MRNRIEKFYSKDRRAEKVAGSHTHAHAHAHVCMLRNGEAYFDIHSFKNTENPSVLSTVLGTGDPGVGRTSDTPVPPELMFIPMSLGEFLQEPGLRRLISLKPHYNAKWAATTSTPTFCTGDPSSGRSACQRPAR